MTASEDEARNGRFEPDETIDAGTAIDLPATDGSEHGGRSRFAPEELRRVIAAFPLTGVERIQEFPAGSWRAPKVHLSSSEGTFLLKRRQAGEKTIARTTFSHLLQFHLFDHGVPVARIIGTRGRNASMLVDGDQVYELFEWVSGRRIIKVPIEVREAGRILGRLHRRAGEFTEPMPVDVTGVFAPVLPEKMFEQAMVAVRRREDDVDEGELLADLKAVRSHLLESHDRILASGWHRLPEQPIHGDWHPGNLIFSKMEPSREGGSVVRAIIDFDAVRLEPRIVDLANGLLHFAMRSDRTKSAADWPISLSPGRMKALLVGWREVVGGIRPEEGTCLPWLMIEVLLKETIRPIARTGTFASVPGSSFLRAARAKADWIRRYADQIEVLFRNS